MILAGAALAQIALGSVGSALSAHFVEVSAQITVNASISVSLAITNAPIGITYYPPAIDRASNLLIAANNKRTTTTSELSTSDLSLTVTDAATWPESGAITLDLMSIPARTPTTSEIAYYSEKAGNVLTLTERAVGGTTAKLWPSGSSVEMRYTAEHHNLHSECIINLQTELVGTQAILDGKPDDADLAAKLDIVGGTMTGALTLAAAPTLDLHAATKRYVDYVGMTVWNVKNYGIMGDGVTDDTAAINALHTAAVAAGGARVYFPRGVYIIGGPLIDVLAPTNPPADMTGHNAQIPIPLILQSASTPCIDWVGDFAPPVTVSAQVTLSGDHYSIIKSTLTGCTGNAAVIGGKQLPIAPEAPPTEQFSTNGLLFNIKDMVFELPPNPTLTALDFSNQTSNRLEHVLVHCGTLQQFFPVEPTHSNAYGAKLSPWNHSSRVDVIALNVFGTYTGVLSGELAYGTICVQCCKVALEIPFSNFATKIDLLGSYGCPVAVKATGDGDCRVLIDLLSIEDDTGGPFTWQALVYGVDDPTNKLHGRFNWEVVQAFVGHVHAFPKNGGTSFIGTEVW